MCSRTSLYPCLATTNSSINLFYPRNNIDHYHQNISQNVNKIDDQNHNLKVRVIQNNLVFVSGIPMDISNVQILASSIYFGRYGNVQKIILNPINQPKKTPHTQAYVTYFNDVEACLAIVALDGLSFGQRTLKVSYGTTKYCTNFLKGYQCPNPQCFYLHKYQPNKQLTTNDTRTTFKKQTQYAFESFNQNIELIIQKIIDNQMQNYKQGFPTIKQTLDHATTNTNLKKQQISKIYQKLVQKKKNQSFKSLDGQYYDYYYGYIMETDDKSQTYMQHKLSENSSFQTLESPESTNLESQTLEPLMLVNQEQQVDNNQLFKNIHKKILKKLERPRKLYHSQYSCKIAQILSQYLRQ